VAAPVAAPVVAAAPVVHAAAPEGSQYHSQDDIGQYSYGYSDPNSVKQEIKTADGVTRGAYSYVDANGIVQTVNYIADALGFRVGATNLPVHVVDAPAAAPAAAPVAVEAAPVAAAAPLPVVSQAYTAAAPVVAPQVSYAYLPYATNYGYNLPATQTVAAAPAVVEAAAPAVVRLLLLPLLLSKPLPLQLWLHQPLLTEPTLSSTLRTTLDNTTMALPTPHRPSRR